MPRRRPRRSRAYLALVLLVGLLGIGELLVRGLKPDLGERPFQDDMLGWASVQFLKLQPEPKAPGDERLRLLALGDSFLDPSYRLDGRDARFPALLERELPEQVVTRTLATQGWGTDQELLAYLEKGRDWQPDVVVLAFCSNNDLLNILSSSHGRKSTKPYFRIESSGDLALYDALGKPLPIQFASQDAPLPVRSYLWDFLKLTALSLDDGDGVQAAGVDPRYALYNGIDDRRERSIEQLATQLDFSPQLTVSTVAAYVHEPGELIRYQWELLERLVQELDSQVRADGARLVFMMLPTTFKAGDLAFVPGGTLEHTVLTPDGPFLFRAAEPRERLSALCDRLGVAFFDPCPEFIREVEQLGNHEAVWPDPGNRHYSVLGQAMLARSLERYLREQLGLLGD
jgi:hypothetical protein